MPDRDSHHGVRRDALILARLRPLQFPRKRVHLVSHLRAQLQRDPLGVDVSLACSEWVRWNQNRFGDDKSEWRPPLKILIVCDRLLTGFDAPVEQVMYLDKPLRDHNLLQAIARTNRPHPAMEKRTGLVVDYFQDLAFHTLKPGLLRVRGFLRARLGGRGLVRCFPLPLPAAGAPSGAFFSCLPADHGLARRHPLSVASPIIPDGYFELGSPNKTTACFLEIDLGTETAKVWKPKIESYIRFAVSEEFERRFHLSQFRVLVITSSPRRLQALRKLVCQYSDKIFWFTTFESIKHDGFWSAVWLRPDGDQPAVALVSSL